MEPLAQMITQLQNLESNLLTVILDTVLNLSSLTDPSFLLVIDSPQGRYWTGKHSLRGDFLSNQLFRREDDVEYTKNGTLSQIDYQNGEIITRKRLSDSELIKCTKRRKSSQPENFDGSKDHTHQKFHQSNIENDDPILVESYRFNDSYEEDEVFNDTIQQNSNESFMDLAAEFRNKINAIGSASQTFLDNDNLQMVNIHGNDLNPMSIAKPSQKKKLEDKEKLIRSEIEITNLAKEYQNDPEVLRNKPTRIVLSVKRFLKIEKEFEEVLGKYGCYDEPNDKELNHSRRMRMRGKKYWKAYAAAKKAEQNLT